MTLKKILFVSTVVLTVLYSTAQQPFMWRVTTDDGLKTNMVYDLELDENGKVWFGLFGGIASYDGHKVTMHARQKDLSMSLTNLQFDDAGNIYCMNFTNEIFRYEPSTDKLVKIENNPLENAPFFGDFILIKNRFFLQLGVKHYIMRVENDGFITDSFFSHENRSRLMPIAEKNTVYTIRSNANNDGHECVDLSNGKIVYKDDSLIHYNPIYQLINNNKLYTFLDIPNKIIEFNFDKNTISKSFQLPQNASDKLINSVALLNNEYWVSSTSGLYVFNQEGHLIEGFQQPILDGEVISSVKRDKQGNTWISTTRSGVYVIPNIYLVDILSNNSQMQKHVAKAVALNNGGWLVASYDNKVYQYSANLKIEQVYPTKQREIINGLLYSAEQNRFWVSGHLGIESFLINGQNSSSFTDGRNIPYSVIGVKNIDLADNMLIAPSWAGVFLIALNEENNLLKNIQNNYALDNAFRWPRIQNDRALYAFFNPFDQDLWVQHPEAPVLYNALKGGNPKILDEDGNPAKFNITKCLYDQNGNVWVATKNSGLLVVKNRKIIKSFTTENGLKSNSLFDIDLFENELWMASFKGLQKLNITNQEFTNYGVSHGIKEIPYQTIAVNKEQVLIGHNTSSLVINKNRLTENTQAPPISIYSISVNRRDTVQLNYYHFSHLKNDVSVSLSTFNYSINKNFGFEYKQAGDTGSWNFVSANPGRVDLFDLKPGKYHWLFRAVNTFGQPSENPVSLKFTISPPYYREVWFQVLMAILIVVVVIFIAWRRLNTLNRQNLLSQEKAAIETEKQKLSANLRAAQLAAIKAQLNPHFMFNALNSIQEFILLNHPVQANKFLGKFSDLMRLTLDNSNEETISLEDELKMLKLYLELEALRFEENFEYSIDNQIKNASSIEIPAMLIQPYVENSIKHGLLHKKLEKRLWVKFYSDQERILTVVIEDNGIGRENAALIKNMRKTQHKSYATSANQTRLELLNTGRQNSIAIEIEDLFENGNATGTRVTLRIPF
ncbi:MAG: histidine kinase [Bacteroidetes bacterium]|nr:histidine kinase [Bacteroidota bacterium]